MSVAFGWFLAIGGLLAGLLVALVPGLPGAAVALVGVAALAVASGGELVPGEALLLATLIAGASGVVQVLAPAWGIRSASSATGAATGAVVFGVLGLLSPLPLIAMVGAGIGALLGLVVGRGGFLARLKAPLGVLPTLVIAVLVDVVAVCGIGAVLALSLHLGG